MQNRIKERIKEKNLKQTELAEVLGMSPVGLNQLVNSESLKIETFDKIAKAMGVPVWMLCLSDEELTEIRSTATTDPSAFRCPVCGAPLKVVPNVDEEESI